MTWMEILRLINCVGCVTGLILLLTIPGGPSNWKMGGLTWSLAMWEGAGAYGSMLRLHDPAVLAPLMVFVAMLTALVCVLAVRHERLGGHWLRRTQGRHSVPRPATASSRAP